jgi:hypothetical protein
MMWTMGIIVGITLLADWRMEGVKLRHGARSS